MRLIEVMMRAATGTNEDFTGEIKDEDMWDSEQSWWHPGVFLQNDTLDSHVGKHTQEAK